MDLNAIASLLLSNHIASSTRKTYNYGLRKFYHFCVVNNIHHIDEYSVLLFIASLYRSKIAPSTVHVYLSAINNALLEKSLPVLQNKLLLSNALKGYTRLSNVFPDQRLPVTLQLMAHIKRTLRSSALLRYVQHLYWCACCFAFFGLLRVSEYTTHSHSVLLPTDHTLLYCNVKVRRDGSILLLLPHSKVGRNERVSLLPTKKSVCPVRAFRSFLRLRSTLHQPEKPLFMFRDNSFLSCSDFNSALKSFLKDIPDS